MLSGFSTNLPWHIDCADKNLEVCHQWSIPQTCGFFVQKFCLQVFCTYTLGLYFFGTRILAQKLFKKCWWNWHQIFTSVKKSIGFFDHFDKCATEHNRFRNYCQIYLDVITASTFPIKALSRYTCSWTSYQKKI